MIEQKVRDLVVVGGGSAGWMTAAAFAKFLGTRNYNLTLIESDAIGTVGVGEATIPMIQLFNDALGLDENEFMRATSGTFKLGIEFVDWGGVGRRYFHPFGRYGIDMDGIGFMHYWLRWRQQGGNLEIARFNAETEAARSAKFMRAQETPSLPRINYAFQFDAGLYAAFLRRFAEARGAVRVEGRIVKVNQDAESGDVRSVELEGGKVVTGDLFIDCSGFRGLLIEETLKAGYEDWSRWLPVNRAAAMPCARSEPLLPYTRSTAREAGWQWRIPLQHRTGNGYVFCDAYLSETEAMEALASRLDGAKLAEPRILKFVTGMRKKSWSNNVVAVGLASGFLEPLESTSIHLAQVAITKLLAFFPKGGMNRAMIERFNREMHFEYSHVRDFIIAHYKVTQREDTPFWAYCKTMQVPDTLEAKLELFRTRGEVMPAQAELFKEPNWFAMLYGQGYTPEGYHPLADAITDEDLKIRLSRIRTGVSERVAGMSSHDDYIARTCAARQSETV